MAAEWGLKWHIIGPKVSNIALSLGRELEKDQVTTDMN